MRQFLGFLFDEQLGQTGRPNTPHVATMGADALIPISTRHCKHYTGRGVMKYYQNGQAFASDMGISLSTLETQHAEHYQAAKKTEKDPDGGSYPAYPSGKSWDACSGKTGSGKKFYHNVIDGPAVKDQEFYVAIITPVIHYCMGGLEIDKDSACIGANGKAILGLHLEGDSWNRVAARPSMRRALTRMCMVGKHFLLPWPRVG